MKRKAKRRPNHVVEDEPMTETYKAPESDANIVPQQLAEAPSLGTYLENIRAESLHRMNAITARTRDMQHDVERTIQELEEWRNEIDSTIAFLKATRR